VVRVVEQHDGGVLEVDVAVQTDGQRVFVLEHEIGVVNQHLVEHLFDFVFVYFEAVVYGRQHEGRIVQVFLQVVRIVNFEFIFDLLISNDAHERVAFLLGDALLHYYAVVNQFSQLHHGVEILTQNQYFGFLNAVLFVLEFEVIVEVNEFDGEDDDGSLACPEVALHDLGLGPVEAQGDVLHDFEDV